VIAAHAANATLVCRQASVRHDEELRAGIARGDRTASFLTVSNNFPAKDMKELIAYAKANPDKISFGSSGVGAAAHLTTELLKQTADIRMVHVPYKGTAPALTALISGDIQVLVDTPSSLMPHVRAGKIPRARHVLREARFGRHRGARPVAEAGGPPIESSTWVMFLAPAGTPKEIVQRVSSETAKIVNSPEMKGRFEQLGHRGRGQHAGTGARVPQRRDREVGEGHQYRRREGGTVETERRGGTMSFMHRVAVAALVALASLAAPALAQNYPNRAITLICPWPAGGGTDTHLRKLAELASKQLGQPIIVENKPGGGGMIGPGGMARLAAPDGYTALATPYQCVAPAAPAEGRLGSAQGLHLHHRRLRIHVRARREDRVADQVFRDVVTYAKANPGSSRTARRASALPRTS
jgi:tripartite-type tricarboxylate transporter receptor subunit TctC